MMFDMPGKFAGATVLAATVSTQAFSHEITVDYIGVPFNVIVASALGAYSGFSFGDKVKPRSQMFQLFIACVFMGAAWTGFVGMLIDVLTEWELKRGVMPALGAIISCLARFFIPELIQRIGPWLDKIPFLGSKKRSKRQPKDEEDEA